MLQPCLRDSLELEEQLVPGHFPLPQRARRKWMRHGKNDELVNAIRMSRSREPRHSGSPVVANDFRADQFEQSLLNARKESDSGTLTHIKFFHRLLHRIARLRKRYTHGMAAKSFCGR